MKVYPKGCRYIVIRDGNISTMGYTEHRRYVESLMPLDGWLVVQPRGKKKWWLFGPGEYFSQIKFIATAYEPDSLIMRALLSN